MLTVSSLLLAGLVTGTTLYFTRDAISPRSAALLRFRLKKPEFRKDIGETSAVILTYLNTVATPAAKAAVRAGVLPVGKRLNDKFRDMIRSAAPKDEPKAFEVVTIRFRPGPGGLLYGVHYHDGHKDYVLFLMDERGVVASSWKALPAPLRPEIAAAFRKALGPKQQFIEQMADEFPSE